MRTTGEQLRQTQPPHRAQDGRHVAVGQGSDRLERFVGRNQRLALEHPANQLHLVSG
jgi:hypothetical protein